MWKGKRIGGSPRPGYNEDNESRNPARASAVCRSPGKVTFTVPAVSSLFLVACTGIAVLLPGISGCSGSTRFPDPVGDSGRTEYIYAMGGIPVQITLFGESAASYRDHLQAARDRIEELEAVLSDYRPESPVSRMNRSAGGEGTAPGPVVLEVLEEAFRLHEMTGGAYDPTVRPLVSLWRRAEERRSPPAAEEIRSALTLVGLNRIDWDRQRGIVRLPREGMELDFGGLGKGYIVDRVVDLLRQRGVTRGIINAGGDLRVFRPVDSEPFRIGIRDPQGAPDDIIGTVPMTGGALATSGNYERFREIDGMRFGHILDPHTGQPAGGILSATVHASTAALADGLATGVFVLGLDRGRQLIESLPEVEGILIYWDSSGLQSWVSPGMDEIQWVRQSALAGRWYEAEPDQLRADLGQYLKRAERVLPEGRPVALIAPHAAHRYSGQAAAYGYRALRDQTIRRVIVLGVSHFVGFDGASIPRASHYRTPLGPVPLDLQACQSLLRDPLFQTVPDAHRREHSVEIQLPFLQEILGEFFLVPVLLGRLDRREIPRVARAIGTVRDDQTLVVASSDFTHYGSQFGYIPFRDRIAAKLRSLDFGAIAPAVRIDPDRFMDYCDSTGITVCGKAPIGVLLSLLSPQETRGSLLCYYTSGELGKDFENSVSYADILYTTAGVADQIQEIRSFAADDFAPPRPHFLSWVSRNRLLQASRRTLERVVRDGRVPGNGEAEDSGIEAFTEPRGCFVTLTQGGKLRGCIGNVQADRPLHRSVLEHTVKAACRDPRFSPVSPWELEEIKIEISVLSKPVPVESPSEILLGWHGIVLYKGNRQAVFLPEVATRYGWSREETLAQLCIKSGLPADSWKRDARLRIFETQTFSELDPPETETA